MLPLRATKGEGMNLKHLTDDTLLKDTDQLVQRERDLLGELLHHLKEIDRRKLFCTLGCSSIYDYCIKRLGYSEDQAYRRISAMRLLKEIPEIDEKIRDGSLTLTKIGMAATFFRREKEHYFTPQAKIAILNKIENQTSRQAEKTLILQQSVPEP